MAIEFGAVKKEKTAAKAGKKSASDSVPVEKRKRGEAKQMLTLRLDKDVVEAFKVTGAGWQSKINDALRSFAKLGDKK